MDDRSIGFLLLLIIATLFFRYNFDNDSVKSKKDFIEKVANKSSQETNIVENIQIDHYDNIFNDLNDSKNVNKDNKNDDCVYIKNGYITVGFSKNNATIQSVKLNKYENYNNGNVDLIDNTFIDNIHIVLEDGDVYDSYKSTNVNLKTKRDQFIVFQDTYDCKNGDKLIVESSFELDDAQHGYELKRDIKISGYTGSIKNIELQIYDNIKRQETNAEDCKRKVVIKYLDKDSNVGSCYMNSEYTSCKSSLQWLNIMQKFFSVGISQNAIDCELKNVKIKLCNYDGDNKQEYLHTAKVIFNPFCNKTELAEINGHLKYYFGPNIAHYMSFFSYNFDKSIYFGIPVIRVFNKYIIDKTIKTFHHLMGINGILVIILLLILFFIFYILLLIRSLRSKKKIELLQPTIQYISEKNSKNTNERNLQIQEIYKNAKVEYKYMFLAQIVHGLFFMSMLTIIPQEISFRRVQFLWCNDLSNYDSIFDFSFNIPLYGNHVSLFTLISLFLLFLISFIKSKISTQNDNKKENNVIKILLQCFIILCFNNTCAALQLFYLLFIYSVNIFEYIINNTICKTTTIEKEIMHNVSNFKKNPSSWMM